jgi:hypothetical protein
MSQHRHTVDGYRVIAVLAGNPDIVVGNIGSVLVCLEKEPHPDGDFIVMVNGGVIPGDGLDPARFLNPLEAFECASAIARDVFDNWIHEQGHNPGPIEQDRDIPVLKPADGLTDDERTRRDYGDDPMGAWHGRNE